MKVGAIFIIRMRLTYPAVTSTILVESGRSAGVRPVDLMDTLLDYDFILHN